MFFLPFIIPYEEIYAGHENCFNIAFDIHNKSAATVLTKTSFHSKNGKEISFLKEKSLIENYISYPYEAFEEIDEKYDFSPEMYVSLKRYKDRGIKYLQKLNAIPTNYIMFKIDQDAFEFGWNTFNWKEKINGFKYNKYYAVLDYRVFNDKKYSVKEIQDFTIDSLDHLSEKTKSKALGSEFLINYRISVEIYDKGNIGGETKISANDINKNFLGYVKHQKAKNQLEKMYEESLEEMPPTIWKCKPKDESLEELMDNLEKMDENSDIGEEELNPYE